MTSLNRASTYVLGLLLFAISSCQSSTPQQKPAATGKKKKTECESSSELRMLEEDVTYETHIKKIFEDNCLSCHSGLESPDLRSYDKFEDDLEEIVKQVVTDKMPEAAPLSDEDKEIFELWQDNNFAQGKPVEDDEKEDDESDDDEDDDDSSDEDC